MAMARFYLSWRRLMGDGDGEPVPAAAFLGRYRYVSAGFLRCSGLKAGCPAGSPQTRGLPLLAREHTARPETPAGRAPWDWALVLNANAIDTELPLPLGFGFDSWFLRQICFERLSSDANRALPCGQGDGPAWETEASHGAPPHPPASTPHPQAHALKLLTSRSIRIPGPMQAKGTRF